jgi:hypothetical protein
MGAIYRYCEVCGQPIYRGCRYTYEYPAGYEREDENGEYFNGCYRCADCGRELCPDCGDFEDGVCISCRKEEEVMGDVCHPGG